MTMMRDMIKTIGTIKMLLRYTLVLLMMVIGGEMNCAWGQTGTNRSGLYYFVNGGSGKDGKNNNPLDPKIENITTPDDYFYLVPADNHQQTNRRDAYYSSDYGASNGDPEKPFLTTYKTKKDAAAVPTGVTNRPHNSVWIVKFASTDSGTDYYYLIHAATGKYVVYEPPYSGKINRKSVHLLTTDSPGENAKFAITETTPSNTYPYRSGYYNFRPKSRTSGNRFLNPGNANYNFYYSSDAYADGVADYFRGLIGLYLNKNNDNKDDASASDWIPDPTLLDAPTISEVDANNKVTIADVNSLPSGYEIRYTIDGSTPAASTGEVYSGAIPITTSVTIKAVVVRYGMVLTELASETREPVPCATPVITFDSTTSEVSITCATDGSTIHYTIDGGTPTAESEVYGAPFPVTGETTVKAIATHTTMATSEVGTLTISQVATPTIQKDNGSNAISITSATSGATIYYTIDGSTPTTSSSPYTTPLRENVSGVTIKAIAVKENMITSEVGSGAVTLQCEAPVIVRSSNTSFTVTCPFPASDVTIYYTTDGGTPNTSSSSTTSGTTVSCNLPATIKAIAVASGYSNSSETEVYLSKGLGGDGSVGNPYTIEFQSDVTDFIDKANTVDGANKHYKVIAEGSLYFSGVNITQEFSGSFDGGTCILTGLSKPLFNTVDGGVVKNVTLKGVAISSSEANVGAIAGVAKGYSRIYNCGILPNDATFPGGAHPTVTTSGACAGSIVGSLQDDSRVINCYSYADVSASTTAAGIVGSNGFASTAEVANIDGVDKYTKLRTAVVNCMFYGNITGGTNQYGVYGGELITNATATGISSYNYYRSGSTFTTGEPTAYNCSFPAEERYLTQVEFHRSLLNSNRELCGWWVYSDEAPSTMATEDVQAIPKDASLMYKWVVEPGLAPYPILKPFGKYASVINNPGNQTGKTLSVTVKSGKSAADKTFDLPITDMDPQNHDYGYYKVQLPYYNTVFGKPDDADWATKYAGNYTDQVVTGWKITAVTGGTQGSFVANWQDGYNFADRKCTDKDKFDVSGRVFAQGGYYYVPDDVTAITIEAYWGKAIYVRNDGASYDRVNITVGTNGTHFAPAGIRGNNVNGQTIQTTTIKGSLTDANIDEKKTVYDYALVLVGNIQESLGDVGITHSTQNTRGFTIMSADFDLDEEPDYCLEWQLGAEFHRQEIAPIRFDFLPVVELGIAGKTHNSTSFYSLGCYRSKGHFEVTETALIRFGQFEFELGTRDDGPIILNGGIYDQYCRGRNGETNQHINYVILGGHIIMPSFTPGAHANEKALYQTRHCAVNVLGGNFTSFYLTGGYNEKIKPFQDNPHCYIDGGHFGTIAAAYKEGIWGNVTWRINHALIDEFYGGGVMSQADGDTYKIVKGNIDVVIDNSTVGKYCGGPKFGNMVSGKTVITRATNTTFTEFYGAGNGGTNYVQYHNYDDTGIPNPNWNTLMGENYNVVDHVGKYRNTDQGYEANYDFEQINGSDGTTAGKVVNRIYYYSAQFATTNTGSVTSELTNCTIETNFYGGGFLGGVNGNITSTLSNCTVLGSVFGAGYSASAGTVTIYDKNKTPPSANVYTGMIKPQSGGTSTTYYWTHEHGNTSAPVTAATAGEDHDYYYTEIPLNNLGAVNGNVTLTLKGTTKVGYDEEGNPVADGGHVYGGGDASAVTGSGNTVTVNLQEKTLVRGNVFGGGNNGKVEGSTIVNVE